MRFVVSVAKKKDKKFKSSSRLSDTIKTPQSVTVQFSDYLRRCEAPLYVQYVKKRGAPAPRRAIEAYHSSALCIPDTSRELLSKNWTMKVREMRAARKSKKHAVRVFEKLLIK